MQANYRLREGVGIAGYQHIAAILQMHAFHRTVRGDHRQAMRHRLIDLAFDSRAKAQRGDRHQAGIQPSLQIRDMAMDVYTRRARQCGNTVRHIRTNAVQRNVRASGMDQRKYISHEPMHRIHIRWMPEPANKQ